ncbi:MAG: tRNA uridine-5-carboxymethylaminomethyl(34) synthesis GTPase MnmE [Pseudomonadota bacterium]|nr:tRNA uridine-5-carboxymethylaminomethyl(34) synthesis GTPase MnmE [Pseudomonadota bacterium]
MLPRHHDPIAAIATAPGRAAVGIVRVSGRDLRPLIAAICHRPLAARHATYLPFLDAGGVAIDHGLAIHFPAPHSYTGEDVLELQAHGGPVVLQLLLARCLEAASVLDPATGLTALPGLRLAMPGEFTERAYLNDKLDLAQAEAVSDLIDASTEAAARSATRSLSGGFSAEIRALDEQLMRLRMLVEATLDFPEEDIDFLQQADAHGQLVAITARLCSIEDRTRQGALLRDGITVVIAGQPNVGKSSLLNALAGAELAIVTPIPGTTRDKVSQTIQIEGVPVHVIDTAGLRDTDDTIEQIGIARSWSEIEGADALLFLHDLTQIGDAAHEARDEAIRQRLPQALAMAGRVIDVFNKADTLPLASAGMCAEIDASNGHPSAVRLSAKTGAGLDALRRRLLELAGWHEHPEGVYTARARHVHALQQTGAHVDEAMRQLTGIAPALDLLAEELRLAQRALGDIVGQSTPDELLGEIFSRFCIGK